MATNTSHVSSMWFRQAFASDVGVDNDPISGSNVSRLCVWYDVLGIILSRERGLDEVKDQVEARWRDDQIGLAGSAPSAGENGEKVGARSGRQACG